MQKLLKQSLLKNDEHADIEHDEEEDHVKERVDDSDSEQNISDPEPEPISDAPFFVGNDNVTKWSKHQLKT